MSGHDVRRNRPWRFAAALILTTAVAGPGGVAWAVPTLPGATTGEPGDAEMQRAVNVAMERGRANDCVGVLAAVDPLLPRLQMGEKRTSIQLLRLPCLGIAGRMSELPAVYQELESGAPRNPMVRSFGIAIAADMGDFKLAGERLATVAEEQPAMLPLVSGEVWRSIAQRLTERKDLALRDRLYVALARAGWQPNDKPELAEGLARGAIEALLAKKETDEARSMLPRISMPEVLTGMAIERVYAPLWPDIEERLGPQSATAIDEFAVNRLETFARAPDDPKVRRDAARAFLLLGRDSDVVEITDEVKVADGMSEDDVMITSYQARALEGLGRTDDALNLMRGYDKIDLATSGEAVSGLVGLAEQLDEAGRSQEALTVAQGAMARGSRYLSGWGMAWLRRTEACALAGLGRTAEAKTVGDALAADPDSNPAATIEGLLCLKRLDEAAKIAVSTLATTEGAGQIADQFQPDGAFGLPGKSKLRAMWQPFLQRPDVKAAFEKAARILPKTLWPSETPREIPRAPDAMSYDGPTT